MENEFCHPSEVRLLQLQALMVQPGARISVSWQTHACNVYIYAWQATQINANSTVGIILLSSLADEGEDPLVGNIQFESLQQVSTLPGCWPVSRLPFPVVSIWVARDPEVTGSLQLLIKISLLRERLTEVFGRWWSLPGPSDMQLFLWLCLQKHKYCKISFAQSQNIFSSSSGNVSYIPKQQHLSLKGALEK